MSAEEQHHASAEAKQHVQDRPVTAPSHEAGVARYLGAQHYRERKAHEQRHESDQPEQVTAQHSGEGPIVVGVDGSRFGREALRWALAEAQRRDCGVRALMVAHTAPAAAAGRPTTMGMATTLSAQAGPEYLGRLADTVRAVLGDHVDARLAAEVVRGGPPETLCAASEGAQLLVVGSHGHGAVFEAVLGSVARYCVRHASCPVVVIPAGLAEPAEQRDEETVGGPEPLSYGMGPLL